MTVNNSMVYHCMIQREGLLSRPRKIGIEGEFKDYILQCFFFGPVTITLFMTKIGFVNENAGHASYILTLCTFC